MRSAILKYSAIATACILGALNLFSPGADPTIPPDPTPAVVVDPVVPPKPEPTPAPTPPAPTPDPVVIVVPTPKPDPVPVPTPSDVDPLADAVVQARAAKAKAAAETEAAEKAATDAFEARLKRILATAEKLGIVVCPVPPPPIPPGPQPQPTPIPPAPTPTPVDPTVPYVKLPKTLTGKPGQPLYVIAETNGPTVKWKSLSEGLYVTPAGKFANPLETEVNAPAPGVYSFEAESALSSTISEAAVCEVTITGTGPTPVPVPPTPGPIPTPVPPGPSDAFTQSVIDAFGTAGKTDAKKFAALLNATADAIENDTSIATTGNVSTVTLGAERKMGLRSNPSPGKEESRYPKFSAIVAQRMAAYATNQQLNAASRTAIAGIYRQIAAACAVAGGK